VDLPAQGAFDRVLAVEDARDPGDLLVAQVLGPPLRIDLALRAHLHRRRRADAVDVADRDVRRLGVGQVHTQDTRHAGALLALALALLVARVAANDVQPALATDQLAVLANTFDTGANFHVHPFRNRSSSRNFGNYYCSDRPRGHKGENLGKATFP